ncbi:MAG: sialidase family protein [Candidatus Bathyarchaeia archaeon]
MKATSIFAILFCTIIVVSCGAYAIAQTMASSEITAAPKQNAAFSAFLDVLPSDANTAAESMNAPVSLALTPAGASGSGWKPDVPVANNANSEVDVSMGSYVNLTTGAVTLYAAYSEWYDRSPWGGRYELRLARSLDLGATWTLMWENYAQASISFMRPSLAVNAYNNTVFVAYEASPGFAGSYDVMIDRYTSTSRQTSMVDGDADNDRYPSLAVEYGNGASNYLYVSYENVTTEDDVDLRVAKSTDWGLTWANQLLRGGPLNTGVYHENDITYVQGNVYVAYRHATDAGTVGKIDVSYTMDRGATWNYTSDVSKVPNDASWPSVAGARDVLHPWNQPSVVIIAYEYSVTSTNKDVLYTWSLDYGIRWTGGDDSLHSIANSGVYNERFPKLAFNGMGTEESNQKLIGDTFHLVYATGVDLSYTQLPCWDIPSGGNYYLGWSSPHGLVTDANAVATYGFPFETIATYPRTVSETLWEPAVAWLDTRDFATNSHDIYYSTPGTDFRVTPAPSSQTVVAGKSIAYYITVSLLAGPTAPASMSGNTWPWIIPGSNYALGEYSVSPINPTAVSVLRVTTSNLMPPGNYQFNATATIGGYRRVIPIYFTVVAQPTLTLLLNPTTVARGQPLTLSGQLTPSLGVPTTIYIYYRYPHQTDTWALATTLQTNAAGTYGAVASVPMSLPTGQYDLVAFWVNMQNGEYAVAPMKLLTIT